MRSDHNQLISVGEIVMANRQAFRIETECEKTESSIAFGCWVYLIIDKLELSDEGVYVCQKDTMHSNYINLTILVPPYIKNEADSSMDIEVVEGSDVELVCDAYGKPDPTIKWFAKNEYYITSEKFLIIKNASRHSIKEYECIADNGVNPSISRTFSLRILYIIGKMNKYQNELESNEKMTTLELGDKTVYIFDQDDAPQAIQKGKGWREAMEGIWACTVCLMCINNLCFCIQWFS
ncbi:limbic system-associated membrane isoform X1 [Brachionus plicatilis]|uniref:Limbic system-associated membrane isoform X1 n=1 Tax=Brachionus plicatilis TaxID=10195 RepID=A0A3M7SPS6_BRAPC|nr:limbic system-associated membrane isoform X1 [Brachionus plicatilis]